LKTLQNKDGSRNSRGDLSGGETPAHKLDTSAEAESGAARDRTDQEDLTASDLQRLLRSRGEPSPDSTRAAPTSGVVVGTLVALLESRTPMVTYPGQPGTAAIAARTTMALTADDIGGEVVLQFDAGDPGRPIILGRLQSADAWPLKDQPAQVQVDADGMRLVVDAKEEITLRCGKASITLTKAGKVIVQGTYVLHKSSGVMRIKGGSVQLN
jgi:hypothetical protein